jgi:hypothetical protein
VLTGGILSALWLAAALLAMAPKQTFIDNEFLRSSNFATEVPVLIPIVLSLLALIGWWSFLRALPSRASSSISIVALPLGSLAVWTSYASPAPNALIGTLLSWAIIVAIATWSAQAVLAFDQRMTTFAALAGISLFLAELLGPTNTAPGVVPWEWSSLLYLPALFPMAALLFHRRLGFIFDRRRRVSA